MPTINDLHATRWNLVKKGIPWNPDFGIIRYFIDHADVGSPVGPEVKLDDGTTAQAFTGCVLTWSPETGVKRA